MDIGLLQMTQRAPQPVKQSNSTTVTSESSFDKVFNKAVQNTSVENDAKASTNTTASQTVEEEAAQVVVEVSEFLEAESLEEVLDVLLVEHDEALLFIEVEAELKPVDEMMNLQDVAVLLDMSVEELQQIITQLTEGQAEIDDVWQVLEQAPQLLAQIASVLQGENQLVTPKEAGQLAKFIQLAQLLGQQSDTVYKQEISLTDAKSALQLFSAQLNENTQQQQPKQNFVQVLQQTLNTPQVQTSTAQVQSMQSQESNDQLQPLTQQVQTQQGVKTVSIVLPPERSAQSEALLKEVQNQISRAQLLNNNGTVKLMMRLFPENLGQIRIEIMQQDGIMQARILATTAAGKELLDSNLNQLKTSLVAQNIQMDRIDIAQSLQSSDSTRDQGLFNQFFRQQQPDQEQEQQGDGDEELATFEELLQEQLVAEEV